MMKASKVILIALISIAILYISQSLNSKSTRQSQTESSNFNPKNTDTQHTLQQLSGSNYSISKITSKNTKIFYTQGLFFEGSDVIVESGGLYDQSTLTRMKYPSLEIIKQVNLNAKYFGEGIARVDNFIYQLTWRERKIIKYDAKTLQVIDEIELDKAMKEGWGLEVFNDTELIATDGSHNIFFLDNKTLRVKKTLKVVYNGKIVSLINDIAYNGKFIFANVYFSKSIIKINPSTGEVVDIYDMSNLVKYEINKKTLTENRLNSGEVLNGIAYDSARDIFVITGKKWGHLYEVSFNTTDDLN